MKPVTRGAWRLVRGLLLVICAGGILAADNSWISTVNPAFLNPGRWFWSAGESDAAELPAAVDLSVEVGPEARLSMGGLLHGLLFERPAGRWGLDSRAAKTESSLGRRLVEFDQISQIPGGDSFSTFKISASFAPIVAAAPSKSISHAAYEPLAPAAVTASGIWNANASGNWSDPGNWSAGIVADGVGFTANFSLTNITSNVTVSLDTSRTIGEVYIGDTDGTHQYILSPVAGSSLTFDTGVFLQNAVLQQSSTSAGDTIAVPLLLNSDLDINNLSGTNLFHISGNISSVSGGSSSTTIWFNNTTGANGNIRVSGNISDGVTGGTVNVAVVNGGTVTLEGANTYTGFTEASSGTLLINGTNSGSGTVFVYDTGTIGGTGTVAGSLFAFGGTVTGATATSVGTLTLQGNVSLATGEGDGGTYLANLSGALSDLLAIGGILTLGEDTTLNIAGAADGVTTYTLATFASRSGMFEFENGIPTNYMLVYHDMDIQLVPIPEPATWVGGALVLAALGFTQRRRFRLR
jgi:hypothetical protein